MPKNVALMVNSLQFGGAERVIADLSVYLDGCGYAVHLFLMDDRDIVYDYRGQIHKISFIYKKNSWISTLFAWQHFLLTWFYKRKYKIDVCISAMDFLNFVNLMTPCGEKRIPGLHNYMWQSEVTPTLKDRLIEWCFARRVKKAYRVVAVSEGIREKALKLYKLPEEKVVTIYNAVDAPTITKMAVEPLNAEMSAFFTSHTFINAGRMVAQKAVHKLILAFSIVAEKCDSARLLLVGEGDLLPNLVALVQSLHVADKVRFAGFSKNPFQLIAKSLAFVFPSFYEGFGNVLIEAMCCKTPVISTDCTSGPREIIAPHTHETASRLTLCEYGMLTAPHDGQWTTQIDQSVLDMAEGMMLLIENEAMAAKYREQSAKRAKDFYVEKASAPWLQILD
jgi:glycosyltransferase involved in cell wall biosynthesis